MHPFSRRHFLAVSTLGALTVPGALSAATSPGRRRWSLDLTPGAIGVSAEPFELIRLAHAHGFESVQPDGEFLARQDVDGLQRVRDAMTRAGLVWGAAGLPVEFRRDDDTFRRDRDKLPRIAEGLQRAGITRIGTWLMPGHNELDFSANLRLHAARLSEVSRILADRGLHLGLEYVGTPSLSARFKFPFVRRLSETRTLLAEIKVPGTGFILDSWHWWTAGDKPEEITALRNEDIIAVDLNDAPRDVPLAEQQDNRRELPAATGVIPVKEFLSALLKVGYDGPVRAEPFNAPLNALDNDAACEKTAAALRKAMALLPEGGQR